MPSGQSWTAPGIPFLNPVAVMVGMSHNEEDCEWLMRHGRPSELPWRHFIGPYPEQIATTGDGDNRAQAPPSGQSGRQGRPPAVRTGGADGAAAPTLPGGLPAATFSDLQRLQMQEQRYQRRNSVSRRCKSRFENNNNIYLARPPRGGWLHRSEHLRVAVMPTGPLGSLTPRKLS
jgi:hypothetical protein